LLLVNEPNRIFPVVLRSCAVVKSSGFHKKIILMIASTFVLNACSASSTESVEAIASSAEAAARTEAQKKLAKDEALAARREARALEEARESAPEEFADSNLAGQHPQNTSRD
jgi:hypothetical protein